MGQVNSRRESRALESDSEPPAPVQGAQPSTKNGRIPGLFRADQRTERLFAWAMLAEREGFEPLVRRGRRIAQRRLPGISLFPYRHAPGHGPESDGRPRLSPLPALAVSCVQ